MRDSRCNGAVIQRCQLDGYGILRWQDDGDCGDTRQLCDEVEGVATHGAELDRLIEKFARRWTVARMPVVDRNILRLAVYEFLYETDVPKLVVLDEAYRHRHGGTQLSRVRSRLKLQTPDLADSRNNIHHHYDIGNEFYRLWLDREALQYTCAYYAEEAMTLEQAQQAKMHHVCRKLKLKPGEQVIEAGGGWGGFAMFMARNYGAHVRSFNISREQIAWSRERAKAEDLDGRVEFIEDDYRNISGRCDVFVSIGMLEHVGVGNYRELGALIGRVLTHEGRGLVHSIGRDSVQPLNPWIWR